MFASESANSALEVRDTLVRFLRRELVGPDPFYPAVQLNGEEILSIRNPPCSRYSAGVLFPQKTSQGEQSLADTFKDVQDGAEDLPEENQPEQESDHLKAEIKNIEAPSETEVELSLANEFLPSAMGLSALVSMGSDLLVEIECASYLKEEFGKNQKTNEPTFAWFRHPLKSKLIVKRDELDSNTVVIKSYEIQVDGQEIALSLHVTSRPFCVGKNGIPERLITFTLLNTNHSEEYKAKDSDCFFQSKFSVSAVEGSPCFLQYPGKAFQENDPDTLSMNLLYRHRKIFAVGHGCSAEWTEDESSCATHVFTDSLPSYEVKPIIPEIRKEVDLTMLGLAKGSKEQIVSKCTLLASLYSDWIDERENEILITLEAGSSFERTARKHLDQCRLALSRIRAGIGLIKTNDNVCRAFQFMNQAMYMQQGHYKLTEKSRNWVVNEKTKILELERAFVEPDFEALKAQWYPFQLGFILMNLESMFDSKCSARSLVDIIWFPTGGGKTEAYLGLCAFSFFLQRLRNVEDSGTIAIMRYTLRLLTAQQFQRAASLICACELIRREHTSILGQKRFSIGLWVGGDVTPNNGKQAVECVKLLENGSKENKFVVMVCPWCACQFGPVKKGKSFTVKGYFKESSSRVIFKCEDFACPFSKGEGLPLFVVDEELYKVAPTLVVGTVDKFALMPWRPDSGVFLGQGINSRPELIIQDELHLISGPLGSMVGLYETMIDALTTDSERGLSPKIIASTATISRASEQTKRLYSRESMLFPPQGLRAGESFFAKEDVSTAGRLYVGVFNSALSSHTSSQIRVFAALLQGIKLIDANADFKDPYWTIMTYFNSLRELGTVATLLYADVPEHIRFICGRYCVSKSYLDEPFKYQRYLREHDELTSRVQSNELPEKLQHLFTSFDSSEQSRPMDVCLATNMIQVGLDVPRLSLMQIVGQPKTTAEYIQASSRVGRGRETPGLVITNLNPGKTRDRSHFEQFRQYHQALYRYVEPTSVTPFALPVRERALHAVIISLIRQWGSTQLRNTPGTEIPDSLKTRIYKAILDRVANTEPEEREDTLRMLDTFFDRWRFSPASEYGNFGAQPEEPVPLMYQAGSEPRLTWNERSYETPSSMRNVDADCQAVTLSGFYPDGLEESSKGG